MGGPTSGNYGGRPTVEDGLTLDLHKLLRDRLVRPGCGWGGTLHWTETRSGRHVASIGYAGHLSRENGRLQLTYTTTRSDGTEHRSDDAIELTTTSQPFGGRRWWFVCPITGDRVSKLYLPPGALTFASRKAHRLGYRSQRESPRERALSRAFNLRSRLGDQGGIGDFIAKPKGMRWRTFDRRMARIQAAEAVVNGHGALIVSRLKRRHNRPR